MNETDPIARSVIHSQLVQTTANRLDVTGVAAFQPANALHDPGLGIRVPQTLEPLAELCRVANLDHVEPM
jgi:hypothetical protein